MKYIKYFFPVILFLLIQVQLPGQLNVITYNIRLNTPGDGEHAWPHRKADVINLLKFHRADIFGLQEAKHEQVMAIDSAFPGFSFVGVGRDDGATAGEYTPVFYNHNKFKLLDSGNFWLSETPGKPGLGWDAVCNRICSYASLQERSTGKRIMVFNTHFDHVGVEARKNAADLIISRIKTMAGDTPVILTGDFNLPPESVPIGKLSGFLNDAYHVTKLPPHGATGTWSGFRYEDAKGKRIDYIFVSDGVTVKRYGALTDSRDGNFFSDHLPVLVEVDF
ncbi:MAG: endonuclease/exonuclease/phosphatase family protein [Bacteroidales bacterium]